MRNEAGKILLYHAVREDRNFPTSAGTNVTPEEFDRQMEFIRKHFALSSLEDLLGGPAAPDRRRIAVTFDDGYADNYTTAYPIIKKYAVPVTFFLTVSQVGRDWDFPRGPYPGLSWERIKEMEDDSLINFASHGLRHLALTRLTEKESNLEINSSRMILEERLSRPIQYFSYPHGSCNQTIIEEVRKAGYEAAFSVISRPGKNYSLRRILISRRDNMFRFQLKLSPLYWPLRRLI